MHVAVSGSHGLIGTALVESLTRDNVDVLRLGRDTPAAHALDGVDAVVHLAGEGIANKRWTDEQKTKILESRRVGTDGIARACASATNGPKVLVSGSAIGFYGITGDAVIDETAPPGDDFLAHVCRTWEAATEPAAANGVRVVNIRTGIVQAKAGGMLGKQLLPFKLGLGGKLGSGKQWLSWITLQDEVRAIRFAMQTESVRGPINLTAPEPVTNAEYTKALGKVLHRPSFMTVPPAALKLALGKELVESLVVSQRIVPRKLLDAGFVFAHPTIAEGLTAALKA